MSIQIVDDANNPSGPSDDDAVAALMASMGGPKADPDAEDEGDEEDPQDPNEADEAGEGEEGTDDEDPDAEEANEEDEDGEQEGDEGGEKPTPAAEVSDDAVVKVTVDGQDMELTVGSLKRLAGQEAALTRKSQEADTVGQRAAAVIQGSLEAVLEDLEAYANVDWTLEGSRMDPEEFAWHREQYTNLAKRRERIVGHAQQLDETLKARQAARVRAEAEEAVKVLSDPEKGIKGWNDQLYGSILSFAVSAGLPQDEVATITNPNVIRIINDARLYREGQKATAEKVNLTPTKVRKGTGAEAIQQPTAKSQRILEAKVKSGQGTDDDATALLMGRWGMKRK